jgi:hypothetical protein
LARNKLTNYMGQLHPNSSANFILTKEKPQAQYPQNLLTVTLSDEHCTGGHDVKLAVREEDNLIRTLYFEQQIPWDTDFELTITRDAKNNIHVRVNQEEHQFQLQKKATYLAVETQQKSLLIRAIDITQAAH